jgi:hypothetical protein
MNKNRNNKSSLLSYRSKTDSAWRVSRGAEQTKTRDKQKSICCEATQRS